MLGAAGRWCCRVPLVLLVLLAAVGAVGCLVSLAVGAAGYSVSLPVWYRWPWVQLDAAGGRSSNIIVPPQPGLWCCWRAVQRYRRAKVWLNCSQLTPLGQEGDAALCSAVSPRRPRDQILAGQEEEGAEKARQSTLQMAVMERCSLKLRRCHRGAVPARLWQHRSTQACGAQRFPPLPSNRACPPDRSLRTCVLELITYL